MLLFDASLSRLVLFAQPYFEVYSHIDKNIKYLLWALCCLPPFCISQETLPIVPGGFALTTTKELWVYWTHHLWYMKWSRSVDRRSRVQTGVTIQGIWNVLCTASNSNFWTQRAFCSSANKSLWAAFSDTAKNRSPLVREVRIKVFLKAASVRSGRLKLICKISIFTLSCNRN